MSDLLNEIDRITNIKKDEIDGKIIKKNTIFKEEPVEFKKFVEDSQFCNFIQLTKKQLDACYAMLYSCTYDDFLKNKDRISKNIFDNPMFNLCVLEWGKGGFKKGTVQSSPSGCEKQDNKGNPDIAGLSDVFDSSPSDTNFRGVDKAYSSPSVNLKFKKKIKVI